MNIPIDLMQYRDRLKVKKEAGKTWLFDRLRRKWVVLQPEELVRQLMVWYLIDEKGYNTSRIKLEKGLKVNKLSKRCDILVYDAQVVPYMLVECKAPQVAITGETFRQNDIYNLPLQAPYLVVTNGLFTYCCSIEYATSSWEFLGSIPDYPAD